MNNLFEKARELAELLLDTKEGKKYNEAKYIFEGDDEAVALLQEYGQKSQQLQTKMQAGESGESFEAARQELNELVQDIKQNQLITDLFQAEAEFNQMVSSVMDVFSSTISGEAPNEAGGCCGGGCSSCGSGGCH